MKCGKHVNEEAVGQCVECGAGICEKCADALEEFCDDGMRCARCVESACRRCIDNTEKQQKKLLSDSIVKIVLYIIGAILIVFSVVDWGGDMVYMLVIGVLFCGIYTGFTGLKMMDRHNEDYELKHGAEYIIDDNGIHKNDHFWSRLVSFIIGTALGVLVTPVVIIRNFSRRKRNKRALVEMYADLKKIQNI